MKKYVLISSISDDKSTSDVIEWLNFYNVPFIRINEQDEIILSEYYFNNDNLHFELIIKNRKKIINPLRWKCFPALVSFINPQNPFTDFI